MAEGLPETIEDLTREELLELIRRNRLSIGVRKVDLISLRHDTLSAETDRCREAARQVQEARWDAWRRELQAVDAFCRAVRGPDAARRRADRARLVAEAERLRAETAARKANRKVERAEAAVDTAWTAWRAETER